MRRPFTFPDLRRRSGPLLLALLALLLAGAADPPFLIEGQIAGPLVELCLDPPHHYYRFEDAKRDFEGAPPACGRSIDWDGQGRFSVSAAPHSFVLSARFEALGSFSTLVSRERASLPPFAPGQPKNCEVRVVDAESRPVAGARVFIDAVESWWSAPSWRAGRRQARTDAAGLAVLPTWEGEILAVSVIAEGFAAWSREGVRATAEPSLAVALAPRPARVVQVLVAPGRPLPGTVVARLGVPIGITGDRGRLTVFLDDQETLEFYHPQEKPWPGRVHFVDGVFTTLAGGRSRVIGRVLDPLGRPAAGARVQLDYSDGAATDETTTGPDGGFAFGPLQTGFYILRATLPGFGDALGELKLFAGRPEVSTADLRLKVDETVLGGVVRDGNGAPLEGVEVRVARHPRASLDPLAPPRGSVDGRSEAGGTYLVGGLRPGGKVDLEFRAAGFLPVLLRQVTADGSRTLDLQLEPAAGLEIAAVDASGDPVAGVRVSVVAAGEAPDRPRREKTTDAAGEALFNALPAGVYEIHLEAAGYIREDLQLVLAAGSRRFPVEMSTGASLEGHFRDTAGEPVAGALVTVRDPQAPTQVLAVDRTNVEGYFRVGGIPQGLWRVEAAAPHRLPVVASLEVGRLEEYRRDFELPPGDLLRGLVLGADRVPLEGAEVALLEVLERLTLGGDSVHSVRELASGRTDAGGYFAFDQLEPGSYELSVKAVGWSGSTRRIEVDASSRFVEIVLPAPEASAP